MTTTSLETQSFQKEKENDKDDPPYLSGPLVFCCGKCNTIIGDSYALIGTHSQLKILTLSGASKVTRNEILETSQAPIDKGSTFVALLCYTCSKLLGRYYITTPRGLDDIRERFTFFTDEIRSYELGKCDYGESQGLSQPSSLTEAATATGKDEDEMMMVKHICVGLGERIDRIEEKLGLPPLRLDPLYLSQQQQQQHQQQEQQQQQQTSLKKEISEASSSSHSKTKTKNSLSQEASSSDYWPSEEVEEEPKQVRKKSRK